MKIKLNIKPEYLPGNIDSWRESKMMDVRDEKKDLYTESLIYKTPKMVPVRAVKPISKHIDFEK